MLPADKRRGEVVVVDSRVAVAGNREAVEDSRVGEGSPGLAVDSPSVAGIQVAGDNRVAAGNREAVADSPVGEGSPGLAVDSPSVVGIPAEEDNPVAEDNWVAADSPAVAADNSRPAEVSRRKSCRTWRKRCCPVLPAFRN